MKKDHKVTLSLRVLVSVYILYLAYGLIKDYGTATNQMVSLAAIIVFIAGGGLILVTSGYKLITKDYDDDRADAEEPESKGLTTQQPAEDGKEQGQDKEEY